MLTNLITANAIPTAAPRPDAAAAPSRVRDSLTMQEAIAAANKTMRSLSNGLEFSLDPKSQKVVVRVIDGATQQVIRQLPSEEMLAIARGIDRMRGLLIDGTV